MHFVDFLQGKKQRNISAPLPFLFILATANTLQQVHNMLE